MRRALARRVYVTTLLAVASMVVLAMPAQADFVEDEPDSGTTLNAKAKITVTGDVPASSGGSTTVSAPAMCWWEKVDLSTDSVGAIVLIYSFFGLNFDRDALDQVVADEEESGKDFDWYVRKTREGATDAQLKDAGCNDPSGPYRGLFIGNFIRPFEPGNPPEPVPDPEEMADVAFESIELAEPELMWNPKVDALGGGTLVNLPTWFWATNAETALGGDDAVRSVTATAAAGGSQMSVTVKAVATRIQIASPGGAATCSAAQATTAYAKGVADSKACTLAFERSSAAHDGGFPVRATVAWTVSWSGTGPGVPAGVHELDGVAISSTTNVPVRESQATVTAID